MKNLLNILQRYYWLPLSLFLLFPSAFASNLVFDDEKKSDTPPPQLNEEDIYLRQETQRVMVEKKGFRQDQVNGALKIALQQNAKAYIIYHKDICGDWEQDNKTIQRYVNKEITKEKNYEKLDYIGVSYPIDNDHQIALLIKNPYKRNPQLIVIDSLGKDRSKANSIQNLTQKLGIKIVKKGKSNYHNQPSRWDSWECGLHTFFNIKETVQSIHLSKSKLELNQNLQKVLKYAFQYEQIEEKLQEERTKNRIEKYNLLKNIDILRKKRGHFHDQNAQDALKEVAKALQLDQFGHIEKENFIPTNEAYLTRERKIEELIKDYESKNEDDIMGIIILNALKNSNNLESAVTFYENFLKNDKIFIQESKELKTKEDKLHNLGVVFYYLGKYSQSLFFYNQFLAICKDKLGKNHPRYSTTLNNIAAVYYDQWKYDRAIAYYNQSLGIYKDKLGKNHPSYATTLHNIAAVYVHQGKYDKAIEYYDQALEIRKDNLGKNHPDYGSTLEGIASVYVHQGKYDKAIEYYKEALGIYKDKLGKNHPSYAITLNNIGFVSSHQGKYDKAIELYNQSLAIYKDKLGKNHPHYATTLNNIAAVYYDQGKYDKAIELYNQVLKTCEQALGKNYPSYAETLNNIGVVSSHQGKYDKAIQHYRQVLKVCEQTLGKNHLRYATTLNNIGLAYYHQGKYDKAIQHYRQVLKIQEEMLGKESSDYQLTLKNIQVCQKNKDSTCLVM